MPDGHDAAFALTDAPTRDWRPGCPSMAGAWGIDSNGLGLQTAFAFRTGYCVRAGATRWRSRCSATAPAVWTGPFRSAGGTGCAREGARPWPSFRGAVALPEVVRLALLLALLFWRAIGPAAAVSRAPVCDAVAIPWLPITSLNPALNGGDDEAVSADLYMPMIDAGLDGRIDWSGSLAERVDVSPDDTRFTVTLRHATWSDGTDVTAADVLYDWALIRSEGETWLLYGFGGIPDVVRTITAPDPHTVVVVTRHPVNPHIMIEEGLALIVPLPATRWRSFDLRAQQSLQSTAGFFAVTDGPYRLLSMDIARRAVLGRNPHFLGPPAASRRVLLDFAAYDNPLEALREGVVDVAALPGELIPLIKRLRGFHAVAVPDSYVRLLAPNYWDPSVAFLRDVRVRVALADAIDQERIVRSAFHGAALPERGFVLASTPQFEPPELRAALARGAPDRAAARRLLAGAGWIAGADGVRRRDGRRLAFDLLVDMDDASAIVEAQLIQDDFRAVGVALGIRQVANKQLLARLVGRAPGWGMMLTAYGYGSWPDGTPYFSSGPDGHLGFRDAHMDALLAVADRSGDPDALYAVERYAYATQPQIFLPQVENTFVARDGLGGVGPAFVNGFAPEHLTLSPVLGCED